MNIKIRISYYIRRMHQFNLKRKNKSDNFTLISQNCLGGVIYHILGMEFLSPTINMFIEDENYVKLIENLEYYLSIDAVPKCENYVDPIDPSIHYPVIAIDDIEVCCLHYHSCSEACEKWNLRRKRVNLSKVFVIANSWNLHNNKKLAERIVKSKYKTVLFTTENWSDLPNCVRLKGDFWRLDSRNIVRPNLTDLTSDNIHYYFEEQFDFIAWLNS